MKKQYSSKPNQIHLINQFTINRHDSFTKSSTYYFESSTYWKNNILNQILINQFTINKYLRFTKSSILLNRPLSTYWKNNIPNQILINQFTINKYHSLTKFLNRPLSIYTYWKKNIPNQVHLINQFTINNINNVFFRFISLFFWKNNVPNQILINQFTINKYDLLTKSSTHSFESSTIHLHLENKAQKERKVLVSYLARQGELIIDFRLPNLVMRPSSFVLFLLERTSGRGAEVTWGPIASHVRARTPRNPRKYSNTHSTRAKFLFSRIRDNESSTSLFIYPSPLN